MIRAIPRLRGLEPLYSAFDRDGSPSLLALADEVTE
jgi:hypothetical protein